MTLIKGGVWFAWTQGLHGIKWTTCKLTTVKRETWKCSNWIWQVTKTFSFSTIGWDGFTWCTWFKRIHWTQGNHLLLLEPLQTAVLWCKAIMNLAKIMTDFHPTSRHQKDLMQYLNWINCALNIMQVYPSLHARGCERTGSNCDPEKSIL